MKYFKMFGKHFEAYIPLDNILSFGITGKKMYVIIEDKSFETTSRPREQLNALLNELKLLNGDHRIVGITQEDK
jgi:DNA-binding LytR/AlgR family response regulator